MAANVRDGAEGADGKPARAKLKEYRSREARKTEEVFKSLTFTGTEYRAYASHARSVGVNI